MKRSKNNSRRIKRLERKTVSGSTVVNAFLGGSGVAGVESFLELSDTPTDYTGDGGKIVAVKVTEDGLEFITNTGGVDTLDDLTDVVIYSVTDGDVLTYDSGTGKWVNQQPTGGAGLTSDQEDQLELAYLRSIYYLTGL